MKRYIHTILCLLLTLLFSACIKDEVPEVVERVRVGDSLPQMLLQMHGGLVLSNQDFRGKTVMLVFFSTRCDDCRRELPQVQQVWWANRGNPNLLILGISRGEGEDLVAPFWQEMNLSFPYSAQTDRHIYELFANSIVPRIYIANPEGKVIATFDHSNMPLADELAKALRI